MMRLVLTQAETRAGAQANRLRGLGHQCLELPFIRLDVAPTPNAEQLMARLQAADCVVPVSPTAVGLLFDRLESAKPSQTAPWPAGRRIAVIGPGSAAALSSRLGHGIQVDLITPDGPPYDASRLLDLPFFRAPAGRRVVVIRGETGREDWIDFLRSRGAEVDVIALYRSVGTLPTPSLQAELLDWIADGAAKDGGPGRNPAWLFSHRESVERCCDWLESLGQTAPARHHPAVVIHPRIAETLRGRGWQTLYPIEPGEPALLAAIESLG